MQNVFIYQLTFTKQNNEESIIKFHNAIEKVMESVREVLDNELPENITCAVTELPLWEV